MHTSDDRIMEILRSEKTNRPVGEGLKKKFQGLRREVYNNIAQLLSEGHTLIRPDITELFVKSGYKPATAVGFFSRIDHTSPGDRFSGHFESLTGVPIRSAMLRISPNGEYFYFSSIVNNFAYFKHVRQLRREGKFRGSSGSQGLDQVLYIYYNPALDPQETDIDQVLQKLASE